MSDCLTSNSVSVNGMARVHVIVAFRLFDLKCVYFLKKYINFMIYWLEPLDEVVIDFRSDSSQMIMSTCEKSIIFARY